MVSKLCNIRNRIFQDPRIRVGTKTTYAFDLCVRAGKAYRDLLKSNYQRLKLKLLSSNEIEWFFLSGGYGIIHALEKARKYQATFNRSIAYQNDIPYTAKFWNDSLTSICDAIILRFHPEWVYIFGSKDYTHFIKQTSFWKTRNNIKMFESTGSAGPTWLSPMLSELADSILDNSVHSFNAKYPKFVKQHSLG